VAPTQQPFLYVVSATATRGTPLVDVESVLIEELDRVRQQGITDAELAKAKAQLKARMVFDNDSVTNIAHQLGYFETIVSVDLFLTFPERIAAVTRDEVESTARSMLAPSNRTIGWFDPVEVRSLKSEV
jgi:zinc protease